MFREFYFQNMLLPMVESLSVDNRELRAVMISSLMAGYVFNTEISRVFDDVKATTKERKAIFAALVQTVLTAKI